MGLVIEVGHWNDIKDQDGNLNFFKRKVYVRRICLISRRVYLFHLKKFLKRRKQSIILLFRDL